MLMKQIPMNSSFECEYKCSRLEKELGVIMPVKSRKGSCAVLPIRTSSVVVFISRRKKKKIPPDNSLIRQ